MGSEARIQAHFAAKAIAKRRELDKQRESGKRDTQYRNEHDQDNRQSLNNRRPIAPPFYQRPPQGDYHERDYSSPIYQRPTQENYRNTRRAEYSQPVSQPRESAPRYVYHDTRNAQPTTAYNNNTHDRQRDEYRPQQRTQVKTCQYCRKPGHDISECRKREYNDNVARRNMQGNLPVLYPSGIYF
ncbi:hypothetical protein ALC62_05559 [Cyphomyrmex costatus]|uniref:CCHC-type domain-containing protein n=1 Tax=Cyphomyrmex costatus TaxID=456900 RepID=A0A151K294_9HYME|nr:hypothetical protein ALC62_05559 [Cyphomyrmex costatus]